MMKKLLLFCCLIIAMPTVWAQTGIQFFKGSWKELLDKARRQNRMIFVDVYTEWCGPCKYMDKFIFTDTAVAGKYNPLFITYRLDAEKGEGPAISRKYNVGAYPTFLFLNSNGYLVHKVVGEKEKEPFTALADAAVQAGADKNNLGNLEQTFREGNRDPQFLRAYLGRLAAADLDNNEVLDAYFKTIPAAQLQQDSTWLSLAQYINSPNSATLAYLADHYDKIGAAAQTKLTNRLFEKLIRNNAGIALKEKRMIEYNGLVTFGRRLQGLNEAQLSFLNRLDLLYGSETRNYDQLKKAGYILAASPFTIPEDSIRREDKRRYEKIMQPFLNGEKDSTKIPDFEEERKMVTHIYARDISDRLYTAARAFAQLPATEKQALADALQWAKRCKALLPEVKAFADLIKELEEKKS
ncbi:thioredoxin family protein [Chitinophaga qingshengii]|uniref:Thioredoxin family protein n=1 Tax=Chitinophaga qingshengii TaxID=1569794 RepID=A0ABR7TRR0_9BACT|nr:thioredoxin family protein [Chitinophaga qingshengii]MBC9933152.1 thioredoxin family protein [Chitinophaga qingshengii]